MAKRLMANTRSQQLRSRDIYYSILEYWLRKIDETARPIRISLRMGWGNHNTTIIRDLPKRDALVQARERLAAWSPTGVYMMGGDAIKSEDSIAL